MCILYITVYSILDDNHFFFASLLIIKKCYRNEYVKMRIFEAVVIFFLSEKWLKLLIIFMLDNSLKWYLICCWQIDNGFLIILILHYNVVFLRYIVKWMVSLNETTVSVWNTWTQTAYNNVTVVHWKMCSVKSTFLYIDLSWTVLLLFLHFYC
jgi:hypothetical protein